MASSSSSSEEQVEEQQESTNDESNDVTDPHRDGGSSCDKSLESIFSEASAMVRKSSNGSNKSSMDHGDQLKLYGLYKHVQNGPYSSTTTNILTSWNPVTHAKQQAWKDCDLLTSHQAMYEYITILSKLDESVGTFCRDMLQIYDDPKRRRRHEDIVKAVEKHTLTQNGEDKTSDQCDTTAVTMSKMASFSEEHDCDDAVRANIPTAPQPNTSNSYRTNKSVSSFSNWSSTQQGQPRQQTQSSERIYQHLTSLLLFLIGTISDSIDWILQHGLGIVPILPRGRLDISKSDLWYGMVDCCKTLFLSKWQRRSRSIQKECDDVYDDIVTLWRSSPDYMPVASSLSSFSSTSTIEPQQKEVGVVVGLSVRSILDMYLSIRNYPRGSEVIVIPPISVPGMIHVLQYYDFQLIPVDYTSADDDHSNDDWCQSVLKPFLSPKTVAIVVVHAFGRQALSVRRWNQLIGFAKDQKVEVWEDSAECYTGLGIHATETNSTSTTPLAKDGVRKCYDDALITSQTEENMHRELKQVKQMADIQFVSFGTIKTSTALGGGIALFRDADMATSLQRLQTNQYPRQSAISYLGRLIMAMVLNFIADSPYRTGLLIAVCHRLGLDFSELITRSVRGFRIHHQPPTTKNKCNEHQKRIQADLIRQIRRQPCKALLSMLLRRCQQSRIRSPQYLIRRQQCIEFQRLVRETCLEDNGVSDSYILANQPDQFDSYWTFPVTCSHPVYREQLSQRLQALGFDVVSGASQLCCIAPYCWKNDRDLSGVSSSCPKNSKLMDSILYIPITSQVVSSSRLRELAHALWVAKSQIQSLVDQRHEICDNCHNQMTKEMRNETSLRWTLSCWIPLGCVLVPLLPQLYSCDCLSFAIQCLGSLTLLCYCIVWSLRWYMSPFYLQSTAFAEHCDLLGAATKEKPLRRGEDKNILSSIGCLDIPHTSTVTNNEREDRKVILTGATGYVGSMILRDMLLHRKALSIDKILVVCRRKHGLSAAMRIQNMLKKPMFEFLKDAEREKMVIILEGDVTNPSLGLSCHDKKMVFHDEHISHFIHCAASVSFCQDLPDAAVSNISSALGAQKFACQLRRDDLKFVHMSTAFVHGGSSGSPDQPLPEQLFSLGPFDAKRVYASMNDTQFYATKAFEELRFPNTYTFSKCICEHLLLENEGCETLIMRPSIVGPAVESPWEAWAGDKPSTIVAGACLHLSSQWSLWYLTRNRVPCIPVDVLSRFTIAKAFYNNRSSDADTDSTSDRSYEKIVESDCGSLDGVLPPTIFPEKNIFNASWDSTANNLSSFNWVDFAIAYLQVSCSMHTISKFAAYLVLWVSARIMPWLSPSMESYRTLHVLLVRGPMKVMVRICDFCGIDCRGTRKVLRFCDLPQLFFPFVRREYHFRSELSPPLQFNQQRYALCCGIAAHRFLATRDDVDSSKIVIGGRNDTSRRSGLFWALSEPNGNVTIRLVGFFLNKILNRICSCISVDISSFQSMQRALQESPEDTTLILAPTHRSFLDFLLLSYLCFCLPELQLDIPFILAANEFGGLPLWGFLSQWCRAIFIRRGRSSEDPNVKRKVAHLMETELGNRRGANIVVFLEGARSRDRRFVSPKTGFLKSVRSCGGNTIVVPLTINYESIPEKRQLAQEASGGMRLDLSSKGLLPWLLCVWRGQIDIGKVHVVAGDPMPLQCKSRQDYRRFVDDVQRIQQKNTYISSFHVRAASSLVKMDYDRMHRTLKQLGCRFWPGEDSICRSCQTPICPSEISELVAVICQFGHQLAPIFHEKYGKWSEWLSRLPPIESEVTDRKDSSTDIEYMAQVLEAFFDNADKAVTEAMTMLANMGYHHPRPDHIFQTTCQAYPHVPQVFVQAAVTMTKSRDNCKISSYDNPMSNPPQLKDTQERLGFWGFADSSLVLQQSATDGKRLVSMRGRRYSTSGKTLSKLLPFIEKELGVSIDAMEEFPTASPIWDENCPTDLSEEDCSRLSDLSIQSSFSSIDRVRHATGHSQEDIYSIRTGDNKNLRIPDAIVWPATEQEVMSTVHLAKEQNWCLIPFGGGTNVSNATRCPSKQVEPRPIISVDMKKMSSISWLNEEDGLAHVEAGITGRDLVDQLAQRGYTMGHEPDSIEFSTLGGWIATKASGMKRRRYGNIEDIVQSSRVVGPNGVFWSGGGEDTTAASSSSHGRMSEGLDVSSLVLGSEGCLGIITSAVIRIWPLPEVTDYDSILFANFSDGLRFVRDVARLDGNQAPASVRLLDNAHYRMGMALRPNESSMVRQLTSGAVKFVASNILQMEERSVVCATILYEGSRRDVQAQQTAMKQLASVHSGLRLGRAVGQAGYQLTYMIAYLRDFAMTYHILGESFETFVPWSKLETLIDQTKQRIQKEHRQRLLPGKPFVGCRVTQLYHEGACVYFYLCMSFAGIDQSDNDDDSTNASQLYSQLEHAARDEVLKQGGSLSHHHGIGKHRASALQEKRLSPAFHQALGHLKHSMDCDNLFGARNGAFAFLDLKDKDVKDNDNGMDSNSTKKDE